MGRHLSWILLNKVLIRAHVAPFQTKLITHNSPGTPPPPPPSSSDNADRGDPTSRGCFPPTKPLWHIWQLVDPFTPEGWNEHPLRTRCWRITEGHPSHWLFDIWMTLDSEPWGNRIHCIHEWPSLKSASMKHYWIHTEFSSGGTDVNPDSQTET